MAGKRYNAKKKREAAERNSKRGKISAERMRARRMAQASEMSVTGTIATTGVFGEHFIELLADPDDSIHCWMRVDGGGVRCPRTCRGVQKIIGEWVWKKGKHG